MLLQRLQEPVLSLNTTAVIRWHHAVRPHLRALSTPAPVINAQWGCLQPWPEVSLWGRAPGSSCPPINTRVCVMSVCFPAGLVLLPGTCSTWGYSFKRVLRSQLKERALKRFVFSEKLLPHVYSVYTHPTCCSFLRSSSLMPMRPQDNNRFEKKRKNEADTDSGFLAGQIRGCAANKTWECCNPCTNTRSAPFSTLIEIKMMTECKFLNQTLFIPSTNFMVMR